MRVARGRRRGVSEVIGTVLMAAMTLIAGAAVFGYVNSQAGISAQAYGQQVGNSVQYLEEKFSVIDMTFANVTCGTGTCGAVTLWLYNTGAIQLSLLQVRVYTPAAPSGWHLDLLYNYSTIGGSTVSRVHDVASGASNCGIGGSSYVGQAFSGSGSFAVSSTHTGTITLTFPPASATPSGGTCPSFGQLTHTNAYTAVVVGLYGNSKSYTQEG